MKRYLLYDSGCSSCGHLAETVRDAVGDSIDLLSLRTAEAKELLDTALPNGWRFAPYVVTVDEQGVHARTGVLASLQLGLWMGPLKAMRVWKVITQEFAPKRRGFLRGSLASVLAILMLTRTAWKTDAQSRNCGSCSAASRCTQAIYAGCICGWLPGLCCTAAYYDKYTIFRVQQQPMYAGQSCTNCAYCWNMIIHRPCACRR